MLRRRCRWLTADECEVAFHDAYAVLLEKERSGQLETAAMHPQQVRAYLVQTALNKALDEGKRAWRSRSAPLDEALATADAHDLPDELAAARWDRARVEELVAELSERQQQIVKLRFFLDRKPDEIQQFLGITERVYRRELERGLRVLSESYELLRAGGFCESRRSMILAYVAGIAGPTRARQARDHLRSCPGCAKWAADMREAARGAAAVIPMVPITGGHGPFTHVLEALLKTGADLRERVVTLTGRLDASVPAYASGARPGAVAAALAGCMAIGGTATYCAVNGVPEPVRALVDAPHKPKKAGRRPRPAAARSAALTNPATVQPRRTTTSRSARPASRTRSRRSSTQSAVTPKSVDHVRGANPALTPAQPRRPGEFDP